MQISLGVRFCKAFISKDYALDSSDLHKSSLRGSEATEAIQKNQIDCHESAVADSRNDTILGKLDSLKKSLDLSFIPILERRRLSEASKIAFGLIGNTALKMPIIFSSQNGEINRCFLMLKDLALHHFASPTAFSLSVLNATPALLAIAHKNHSEILAISAKDSLEYGLINAYMLLYDSSDTNCLVISYDERLDSKEISAVIMCVSLDKNLPQIVIERALFQDKSSLLCNGRAQAKQSTNNTLDSSLQATFSAQNDKILDCHDFATQNLAMTDYVDLDSNLAFLCAVAGEISHYQNGDFAMDLGDFLKGFSLADL